MGFLYSPQILCEKHFVLRGIQRDMIINVHWSECKEPVILATLWRNWNFLDRFPKNTQISNILQILPVGTESFHADGQTDIAMLIAAFRNFANAPKNTRKAGYLLHIMLLILYLLHKTSMQYWFLIGCSQVYMIQRTHYHSVDLWIYTESFILALARGHAILRTGFSAGK